MTAIQILHKAYASKTNKQKQNKQTNNLTKENVIKLIIDSIQYLGMIFIRIWNYKL